MALSLASGRFVRWNEAQGRGAVKHEDEPLHQVGAKFPLWNVLRVPCPETFRDLL